MPDINWQLYWQDAFDEAKERNPEFDPADYYRSGRAPLGSRENIS